jgi:hypothetical protein
MKEQSTKVEEGRAPAVTSELSNEQVQRIWMEERFRAEVRQSLQDKEANVKDAIVAPRVSAFLNSPFGLWFLSSVVLGLLSWGYTGWTASRTISADQVAHVRHLATELQARVEYAQDILKQHSVTKGNFDFMVVQALSDANVAIKNGLLPEFASRTTRSLLLELRILSGKSRLSTINTALASEQQLQSLALPMPFALEDAVDDARVKAAVPLVDEIAKVPPLFFD